MHISFDYSSMHDSVVTLFNPIDEEMKISFPKPLKITENEELKFPTKTKSTKKYLASDRWWDNYDFDGKDNNELCKLKNLSILHI